MAGLTLVSRGANNISDVTSVGLARTMYIRCVYVFLAGKSPYIRSYTVYIYGSGQTYTSATHTAQIGVGVPTTHTHGQTLMKS